ncbi:MAG: methyltransferase [Sulfitobacter sp.]
MPIALGWIGVCASAKAPKGPGNPVTAQLALGEACAQDGAMNLQNLTFETQLLDDVPSLMALRAGLNTGVLRVLLNGPVARADIGPQTALPSDGLDTLLGLFRQCGMAGQEGDYWHLTPAMHALMVADPIALKRRADFVALAACDVLMHGDSLLSDPQAFQRAAATFRFFRYDRALGTGAAHLEDTAPWADYVSDLTAREGPDLGPLIPLEGVGHLLEVGGNTGVFARGLLELNAGLRATVLDLPAVCHLGARRRPEVLADRLAFLAGDAREIAWPAGDAVLFKSVLHDWTEEAAELMLNKAVQHVPVGGRVIICERGPIAAERVMHGATAAANLVFAQYYRPPEFYEAVLEAAGLRVLPRRSVTLDMAFHVVAGERV